MNRRSFLKRCGLLPFIGSLAAVSDSGPSEGKPKAPMCASEVAERYSEIKMRFTSFSSSDETDTFNISSYIVYEDGSVEPIPYWKFYKQA